jgi:hypothetical protein
MFRTLTALVLIVVVPAACLFCLWLALLVYTHTAFGF